MVIKPAAWSIASDATALVAAGATQPEAYGAPFAAFSATAAFAEPASAKPSVTFARTV